MRTNFTPDPMITLARSNVEVSLRVFEMDALMAGHWQAVRTGDPVADVFAAEIARRNHPLELEQVCIRCLLPWIAHEDDALGACPDDPHEERLRLVG